MMAPPSNDPSTFDVQADVTTEALLESGCQIFFLADGQFQR